MLIPHWGSVSLLQLFHSHFSDVDGLPSLRLCNDGPHTQTHRRLWESFALRASTKPGPGFVPPLREKLSWYWESRIADPGGAFKHEGNLPFLQNWLLGGETSKLVFYISHDLFKDVFHRYYTRSRTKLIYDYGQ
jgi:hypothetical protein